MKREIIESSGTIDELCGILEKCVISQDKEDQGEIWGNIRVIRDLIIRFGEYLKKHPEMEKVPWAITFTRQVRRLSNLLKEYNDIGLSSRESKEKKLKAKFHRISKMNEVLINLYERLIKKMRGPLTIRELEILERLSDKCRSEIFSGEYSYNDSKLCSGITSAQVQILSSINLLKES